MIDLNPLVIERHPIKPPPSATAEEYHCQWYSLTDRVQYLPGGLVQGKVSYTACFHDLSMGLQTHVYAPMGLDIKNKWTLGGSLPGEPIEAVELGIGVPRQGLWLREDVDMKCNMLMTGFVKKTLKKAHATLVARLVQKAHIVDAAAHNETMSIIDHYSQNSPTRPGSFQRLSQNDAYSDTRSMRSSTISQTISNPSVYNDDLGSQDSRWSYQSMSSRPSSMTPNASPDLHLQSTKDYMEPVELPSQNPQNPNKLYVPYKSESFSGPQIHELPGS